MNRLVFAALAVLALACVTEATWPIALHAGTTVTTITAASTTSLALVGGIAILKGILLATALRRGKRSAVEQNDAVYAILANSEPDQCYRRLICDMAAGAIPDNDKILTLFAEETSPISPKFEYTTAAKVGKIVKSSGRCELRYSCPLNTVEIQKLFA